MKKKLTWTSCEGISQLNQLKCPIKVIIMK